MHTPSFESGPSTARIQRRTSSGLKVSIIKLEKPYRIGLSTIVPLEPSHRAAAGELLTPLLCLPVPTRSRTGTAVLVPRAAHALTSLRLLVNHVQLHWHPSSVCQDPPLHRSKRPLSCAKHCFQKSGRSCFNGVTFARLITSAYTTSSRTTARKYVTHPYAVSIASANTCNWISSDRTLPK